MCSLKSCNDNGSRLTLVVAICVEIQDHYSSVSLLSLYRVLVETFWLCFFSLQVEDSAIASLFFLTLTLFTQLTLSLLVLFLSQ